MYAGDIVEGCGLGNGLKGFISFLSIFEDTKMTYQNKILCDYQNILNEIHIINDNTDYNLIYSWRFLILKDEENVQCNLPNEFNGFELTHKINATINIFSTNVAIDWYYDRSLICDKVYNRIMNGINRIVWHDQIIKEVDKMSGLLNGITLGISVRTWHATHEHNVNRIYKFEEYAFAIQKMIQEQNIQTIFLSYDNHNVKNQYIDYINNLNQNINIITYTKLENITDLQYATIKMLLLAKCDNFICNRISTFSELVFWFNGCNQKVIALM